MTDTATSNVDELRIARTFALALPIATLIGGAVAFALAGLPAAILTLAAGVLLGVIALLWASLRVLSGEAPIPPDLEGVDLAAPVADALSSRKAMLLRALKDLEYEQAIGKLDRADFEEVSLSYREELKDVMKQLDALLAPHRKHAEELAQEHLVAKGLLEPDADEPSLDATRTPSDEASDLRVACRTCGASNEGDSRFCKACGAAVASERADET
jgi:hypothetical protein